MTAQSFEVGERVRVLRSPVVPAGTLGRIHAALLSATDLYFVRFDGEEARPRLMHVSELERVTDEGYG